MARARHTGAEHNAAQSRPWRQRATVVLALAAVLALTASVYRPGLGGPLLLDDRPNLMALAGLDASATDAWQYLVGGNGGTVRPVSRASFLLDWRLWGDDVRAFKATNIGLHLVCGVLLFALARALLETRLPRRQAAALAVFACAFWLLAPLQVSTVLYVVQRMAQLAALFTLAGLLLYVHARRTGSRAALVACLVVCWPLAALSKENGILLPLLALLVDWWWLEGEQALRSARRWLPWLVAVMAALALIGLATDPQWLLAGYHGRDYGLLERLLTQPRVLMDYLGNLLLLPGSSPMGLFRDDYLPSRGLLTPLSTLPAAAGVAALVAAALLSRRTRLAPAGFGLIFFLAAHLLESSALPLELYFEHRNYLPAAGIFLGLAWCGWLLAARLGRSWSLALGLALVLQFALLGWQRALLWRDEATLYAHAAGAHPRSARAHLGLAGAHFNAGRFDAGKASLDRAADLMGDSAGVGIALQIMAAHCVHGRQIPDTVYQRVERSRALPGDAYTVNALAWTAGAVPGEHCPGLDRARLGRALSALEPVPMAWARGRERLRDENLARLLEALAEGR